MAVVGDELYIFGGKGNKYGKQELSTHYYLGLYAINLKSKQSRTIWEKNCLLYTSYILRPEHIL